MDTQVQVQAKNNKPRKKVLVLLSWGISNKYYSLNL